MNLDEYHELATDDHPRGTDVLQRNLQALIEAVEFTKFDPVIVFEEPALLESAGGHMPLGLIAHWD